MSTRISKRCTGWIKVAAVLALCGAGTAVADPAADAPPGLTTDQLVAALHAGGFEARLVTEAPLPKGALSQVLTGTSGAKVLIDTFGCPTPNQDRICALTFLSVFSDAGSISNDAFFALNAVSFSKVLALLGPDGKQSGFRVFYVYPCQGFADANFVPMVLRTFGDSIATVVAAYRTLGAQKPSVARAPTEAQVQRAGI